MPIKFRCRHCRQFLGISRTKAGEIVDCPTCGRSVRVPLTDGKSEPVPQPKLDFQDSSLAGALDELAMIGLGGARADDSPEPEPELFVGLTVATSESPPPIEIVAPPTAPDPIVVEPPPELTFGLASKTAPQRSAPEVDAAFRASADADPTVAGVSLDSELEALAETVGRRAATRGVRRGRPATFVVVSVFAATAAAAFGAGFWSGRTSADRGREAVDALAAAAVSAIGDAATGNDSSSDAKHSSAAAKSDAAMTGRITYKTSDGDSRPDRGARVLVFPLNRASGDERLSPAGFRASDSADDAADAARRLEALGGGYGVVDGDGEFSVSLPAAGEYRILVVSHFKERETGNQPPSSLIALLKEYFDGPQRLLGRLAYYYGHVRYKGGGPVVWDHSFDDAG